MKYLLVPAVLCAFLLSSGCTQSPEKLVAAGNRYHERKKFAEASILYQKAITKDKTNAEAYYRQGLNLIDQGDFVNASKFLRRAVDLRPDNVDAEAKLAQIYLSAYSSNPNKFKSLLPEIRELDDKVLHNQPGSFEGLKLQALLYLVDGKKDKALDTFARANQTKPFAPDLLTWYAETLVSVDRQPEAESLIRGALTHDPKWGAGYDFLFLLYTREKQAAKAEAVLRERVQKDPLSPIGVQNLASYLANSGRFPEAEGTIKRVLDDKKAFPVGHEMLGDFYFRAQKYDLALQQYQAGANEDSKTATQYQQRMVNVYERTGRTTEALRLVKVLAEKEPKNASVNEMYGSLLLQNADRKDIGKSVTDLKALVDKNPEDSALHMELAQAYFGNNEMDKSLNEANQAMQQEAKHAPPRPGVIIPSRLIAARIYEDRGQHTKAIEQTSVILQAQPRNPEARLIKARAMIGINEAGQAQPDLEALQRDLQNLPDSRLSNDVRLQLGNLYLEQKQFDKANAEFDRVWKANPPDSRGYVALQTLKLAQGKSDEAIQGMKDLVGKNPAIVGYRYQLAGFEATAAVQTAKTDQARAKQLLQEAADNYKEILKTAGNAAEIWIRLGVIQRQLGQFDASLASFQQAGAADPHNGAAVLNQAMLLEALGKKKQAADTYNKVLGIDPDNTLALNNLAFLNAEEGTNLDQAMTFAERAKKKVPNSPDVSDTLGYVYLQKNLNVQALQIFRQVVQESPQNAIFRLHLAMALLKQGDRQGAKDEALKAMKNASQPDQQNRIQTFVNQIG